VCIQNKDIDGLNKVKNDFNEMKKKIEELENELYVDELTGIHNRKYLNSKIIEDNKIKEEGEFFIIDLNDFKFINDTYGHIIGDKTLQIFTSTLKNKFDKISKEIEFIRFAGDEFIIISPIHYSNSVVSILEEVKELFNKRHIKVKDKLNSSFQIKFSYGNKKFEKNESYEEIFNKTDKKMYENKTKDKKLK
jgi:diguanylate cyclase (GGDEF)-like protein